MKPLFKRWDIPRLMGSNYRGDDHGTTQLSPTAIAAESQHWSQERHQGWNSFEEVRPKFHPRAWQLVCAITRDLGHVGREQQQSPQGRVRSVIDLSRALMTLGLVLTLVAVALLVGRAVGGHLPSLAELAWVAIALLIASRETR